MKSIFFDSSTLISLALTCTLGPFTKLQQAYGGDFYITPRVKKEVIDRPRQINRFKLEAYRLNHLLDTGTLRLYTEKNLDAKTDALLEKINNTFFAHNRPIKIVHGGEINAVIAAKETGAEAIAIDERTTRLLIENPEKLAALLQAKLHTPIKIDSQSLEFVKEELSGLNVIRSTELAIAFLSHGFAGKKTVDLLDALLWALKLNGCAISSDEIADYNRGIVE